MRGLDGGAAASRLSLLRASQKDEFFCRAQEQKLQLLLLQLRQLLLPGRPSARRSSGGISVSASTEDSENQQSDAAATEREKDPASTVAALRDLGSQLRVRWKDEASRRVAALRASAAAVCLWLQRAPLCTRTATQFLYFLASTAGCSRQTLGEEFCELRTVRRMPSRSALLSPRLAAPSLTDWWEGVFRRCMQADWHGEERGLFAGLQRILFCLLRALPFAAAAALASFVSK